MLVNNNNYGLKLSFSIQEAREVDHVPTHLHEVPAHKAEAEAARYPQREGVWMWPGRASSQLWPRWWVLNFFLFFFFEPPPFFFFSYSLFGLNRGHSVRLTKCMAGFQLWFVNAVCVAWRNAQRPPATMLAAPAWLSCHSNLRLKRV